MNQNAKNKSRDDAKTVSRDWIPARLRAVGSRLISIGNEQLQDLKNARADGRLRPYRVVETGGKRSIVEVDGDKEAAIVKLVAKSATPIDRNR